MTITICSGLIVFPQKLSILQIGEINCFKSQVDFLWQGSSASSWLALHLFSSPQASYPAAGFCRLGSSGRERLRV